MPGTTEGKIPGPPLSELELLQYKCEEVADESLESTRRMKKLCEESKDAGIRTLVAIDDQGEKLDRVEENLDRVNTDLRMAEQVLAAMEQCCPCALPCGKEKQKEDHNTWNSEDDGQVVEGQPGAVVGGGGFVGGTFIAKITNDVREAEMEENMQETSAILSNLRHMAIDMGSEISNQNAQLTRTNLKADSNQSRLAAANAKATKLNQS